MSGRVRDRYARLAGRFWRHPKIAGLSPSAGWLWTRALSYAVDQLTDGVIPKAALPMLGTRLERAAAELVAAGLWDLSDDGWRFHDFAEHNITRDKWAAELKRKADDKARERARKAAHVTGDIAGDIDPRSPGWGPVTSDAGRRTQDAGRIDADRSPVSDLDQVARAPASRAREESPSPAPNVDRSPSQRLIDDAETIRSAVAAAFKSAELVAPRSVRDINGKHWQALVDPVREIAARESTTVERVAVRLAEGFLASPRARKAHYPIGFLAENPGEYLATRAEVSDFSHVDPDVNVLADDD